ncbi:MAG: MFS transporter [Cyanobacteria bacterium P01_A01_bin.37]
MVLATPAPKVLWVQVWGLALVQGAIALTWVIYNLYLVELLTQFGFSASLATILLVIENILAAVIEPLMGNFSDGLQHKMGTRFPFIALGMIIASACFLGIPAVLVFTGPSGMIRWLLPIMLVAWAIAMTLFRSPALSLLGRYAFRTQLPQAASILTLVGGVTGALAPLAGNFILRMGPLFTFFIGSLSLLGAAVALRAVGPNQRVIDSAENLTAESTRHSIEDDNAETITPMGNPSVSMPMAFSKLALVFGAGMGVALGFRLVMQIFPKVLSEQVPDINSRFVLGAIFVSLALTAIPAGKLAAYMGMRLAMITGLGMMSMLTLLVLIGKSNVTVFGVAIALGICLSLVSNTTLPFALSMVPDHKSGLGTGMYFSGGAVASSAYGMMLSNGIELSSTSGAYLGAIAFLCAAACTMTSFKFTT